MHRAARFALALVILAFAFLPGQAQADDARPIQLSLVPSVQLFPEQTPIHGVRLAIAGSNSEVMGLDLGFVLLTKGPFSGLAVGLANVVDGEVTGLQYSFVNYTRAPVAGMQWGWYNRATEMTGVQWGLVNLVDSKFNGWQAGAVNLVQQGHSEGFLLGLVNVTEDMNGLQLGFVNMTNHMHGLQIGLLNVIKDKENLPILPIVNWSF